MTDLKFRAWDTVNKLFYVKPHLRLALTGQVWEDVDQFDEWYETEPDRFVIERFTGLRDKNGKEIWEGDIVRLPDAVQTMVVLYQAPSFVMKVKASRKTWSEFNLAPEENQFCEVIGNVHENPELLKEKS